MKNTLPAFLRNELYAEAESIRQDRICGKGISLDSIEDEIRVHTRITQREIFIIGELLFIAKDICRQRNIRFKTWVNESFDFSYETAKNFMNVFRNCVGWQEMAEGIPISILYQVASPGFPDQLREYLYDRGGLEKISGTGFKRLLQKYREGDIDGVERYLDDLGASYTTKEQIKHNLGLVKELQQRINELNSTVFNRSCSDDEAQEIQLQLSDALSESWSIIGKAIEAAKEKQGEYDEKFYKIVTEG